MQCSCIAVGTHIDIHAGVEEIFHDCEPVVERSENECLANDLYRVIGGWIAGRSADIGPIGTVDARIIEE